MAGRPAGRAALLTFSGDRPCLIAWSGTAVVASTRATGVIDAYNAAGREIRLRGDALKTFLEKNPDAPYRDRLVARSTYDDLQAALAGR